MITPAQPYQRAPPAWARQIDSSLFETVGRRHKTRRQASRGSCVQAVNEHACACTTKRENKLLDYKHVHVCTPALAYCMPMGIPYDLACDSFPRLPLAWRAPCPIDPTNLAAATTRIKIRRQADQLRFGRSPFHCRCCPARYTCCAVDVATPSLGRTVELLVGAVCRSGSVAD